MGGVPLQQSYMPLGQPGHPMQLQPSSMLQRPSSLSQQPYMSQQQPYMSHPQPSHSQQPYASSYPQQPYTSSLAQPSVAVLTTAVLPPPGYACDQNEKHRKYMEDAHTVIPDLEGLLYCGMYDGHGGSAAVEFVQAQLHVALAAELRAGGGGQLGRNATDVHAAFARSFAKVDRMLMQTGAFSCGTTAAVCLLYRPLATLAVLHVANVGDSRALLVGCLGAKRLSVDHRPDEEGERQRLQREGIRVANGRVQGSLAVSRALGDHSLKSVQGGVSCEPYCISHSVEPDDLALVLASDGLWDFVTDEDVHAAVIRGLDATPPVPAADIAESLVRLALTKGSRDNVGVLLVPLS